MKPTIRTGNENKLLDFLLKHKIPHTKRITNSTTVIKTEQATWICSDSQIPFKDLAFMNKVKKEAIIPVGGFPYEQIKYNSFRVVQDGVYPEIVEIDLNGAYWKAAHMQGIITDEIYQEGLEKPKHIRLAALGALATHATEYYFNGNDYFERRPEDYKTPELMHAEQWRRSAFFHVAAYISRAMQAAAMMGGNLALFFWVDALFVRASAASEIQEFINKKYGFDTKVKEINFVDVWQTAKTRVFDCYMADETTKTFRTKVR